jgi:anti-sigma factor RsiW
MIGCRKVKRLLVDYLEGTLSSKDKVLIEEHLRACPDCAKEAEFLSRTLKLVRLRSYKEPPEEFWAQYLPNLKKRIEEVPTVKSLPRLRWRPVPAPLEPSVGRRHLDVVLTRLRFLTRPAFAVTTLTVLVLLAIVIVNFVRQPQGDRIVTIPVVAVGQDLKNVPSEVLVEEAINHLPDLGSLAFELCDLSEILWVMLPEHMTIEIESLNLEEIPDVFI